MARERTYGWTPEQMARINALREARGQNPYIDKNMGREDYSRRYIYEAESRSAGKRGTASGDQVKDEEEMSLADKQAERTKKFREKFAPKGSMAAEYGVKSRMPSVMKGGVRGGVGTSLQDSFDRIG